MRQLLQTTPNEHAILILTLLILEGEQDLQLLQLLPQDEGHSLFQLGQQISQQAPHKQLLPQLVTELKRRLKLSNTSSIEQLDPEWLVDFLQQENPQAISALLQNFPRNVSEKIARSLPQHIAQRLPMRQQPLEPEILKVVRDTFEKKGPVLNTTPPEKLDMSALTSARSEELFVLIRELGFRELAIAFRGAGKGPLTELCRRLGAEEAENLLDTIRRLPPSSPEEIKDAQRTIRAISFAHRTRSEIIEEAGINLIRLAFYRLNDEQKQSIAYRLPRRIGQNLLQREGSIVEGPEELRLQHRIVDILRFLSEEGRISPHWKDLPSGLPPLPEPEHNTD